MAEPPDPAPGEIAVEMLLNGWGYNWYRHDNRMRADDLLIRARACESLQRAAASLRVQEAAFRAAHLPPPSREAPYPDPARMRQLRGMQAQRAGVEAMETQLRGSAVPTDDKIWQRHRDNAALLAQIVEADTALIGAAHAAERAATEPMPSEALGQALARLQQQLRERRTLLDWPESRSWQAVGPMFLERH